MKSTPHCHRLWNIILKYMYLSDFLKKKNNAFNKKFKYYFQLEEIYKYCMVKNKKNNYIGNPQFFNLSKVI